MEYRSTYIKNCIDKLIAHPKFQANTIDTDTVLFCMAAYGKVSGNVTNLTSYKAAIIEVLYKHFLRRLDLKAELGEMVINKVRFGPFFGNLHAL